MIQVVRCMYILYYPTSHSSNSEQQYEGGRQCNSKWMTDQKMQTKKLTFGQPTNLCTKAGHEITPQISTLH